MRLQMRIELDGGNPAPKSAYYAVYVEDAPFSRGPTWTIFEVVLEPGEEHSLLSVERFCTQPNNMQQEYSTFKAVGFFEEGQRLQWQ